MIYRKDRYGNEISVLGYGCMRFTQKLGRPDMEKTEKEILLAIEGGVNYFDTAYVYPGSEAALGQILAKNGLRDKVNIATKLPHYLIRSKEGMEKLFQEELKRLQTDHVDYYLMHMLSDIETWNRLCELGIKEWIQEKKRNGQIRQIGFSYHGNSNMFCRLVDVYDWDFVQIQYNYMDEHTQAGRKGLMHAAQKGIPVIIMEPLRGGKLVSRLPEEAKKIFAEYPVKHTPAQWAFKWLFDQPQVSCVLSGMNSEEMVRDNIQTASETRVGELGEKEQQMLKQVAAAINAKMKVGCTGCAYCMPCPKNVDIPGTFAAYNRRFAEGRFWAGVEYMMCTALRKDSTKASNCIGCGKCEKHCPQNIQIREELKNAQKELEGPVYRIVRKAVELFKAF
ncbi:MAG: aldo/keto reductase [Lachnospiraceae bacterium]|nr:aldo/keto reductase [Lachnospiraceae bacterium]